MYPVLLTIPLPHWSIPLAPALLAVAAVGAVVALFGWRARAVDLLAIGICICVGGAGAALALRGDLYTLTEIPLSSYGVTLCLALVVAYTLMLGLAKQDGLPRDATSNCFVIAAISGFIFSRLLYAAVNLDDFSSLAEVASVRRGGLAIYGGLVGGALAAFIFLRIRQLPLLPWGDVAAPALALGIAIGRVGSYLLGSGFGVALGPWAPGWLARIGTFPRWPDDTLAGAGSPAWVQHVTDGLIPFDAAASLPVHPTQLYEALGALGLLAVLFVLRQRQSFRGQLFLAFVFGYGALRLAVDAVRGDAERGLVGPHLAQHQYLPLAVAMLAAAYVLGPSRSVCHGRLRQATQLLSVMLALGLYFVLRPQTFALPVVIQLSSAQWLGLLTAVAAAVAWALLAKVAETNPASAMSLDLPEPDGDSAKQDRPVEPPPTTRRVRKAAAAGKRHRQSATQSKAEQQSEGPPAEPHPEVPDDEPDS
jgi:phosphatidylglycerol:prolipoprotein diacylglycerol transferase